MQATWPRRQANPGGTAVCSTVSSFPEKSDLLVTGARVICHKQTSHGIPRASDRWIILRTQTQNILGDAMSCYLVHTLQRCYPAKPCEQERWPGKAPLPQFLHLLSRLTTGLRSFKENESGRGNTQDSIWILGTGHQGTTWFVPGTGGGVVCHLT